MPKDVLCDISVKPALSEQLYPITANRSTTCIFHNQTTHIGEQNISYITSTDTYADKHALTANCLADLLAYLLVVEAFFANAGNARL